MQGKERKYNVWYLGCHDPNLRVMINLRMKEENVPKKNVRLDKGQKNMNPPKHMRNHVRAEGIHSWNSQHEFSFWELGLCKDPKCSK